MENIYNAEIILRKVIGSGRIICSAEGSLADQKHLLGYYVAQIAKALELEDIDTVIDDICDIAIQYFEKPKGENCVYEVSAVKRDDETESQSDETPTDCEHCRNENSCLYKDIYPNGCSQFATKE